MKNSITKSVLSKLSAAIIAVLIGLIVLTAAVVLRFVPSAPDDARAEETDFGWEASVRYQKGSEYLPLANGDSLNESDTTLYFFVDIKDSTLITNNTYFYARSDALYTQEQLADAPLQWERLNEDDGFGANVRVSSYKEPTGKYSAYFYFRRAESFTSSGITTTNYEYYSKSFFIKVNSLLSEENVGIESVKATYLDKNKQAVEYKGEWIAAELTFTVVTKYMAANGVAYDMNNERLYYSYDGETWTPMKNNVLALSKPEDSFDGATISFRSSTTSGNITSDAYVYGANPGEPTIRRDAYEPRFSVLAKTDGGATFYTGGSWTSNAVSFEITDESNCKSKIVYSYSDGSGQIDITGGNKLNFNETPRGAISFSARNEAGVVFRYGTSYVVNIDKVTPNVNLGAATPDPDNEASSKKLDLTVTDVDSGVYSYDAGYANGKITISVFNRDRSGKVISNKSGAVYYYQARGAKGSYPQTWTRMTASVTADGETYYTIDDAVGKEFSVSKYYKFKIVSGAGLESKEAEVKFTIVRSAYVIDIDGVDATLKPGAEWISDKAVVRMIMPTDSVLENGESTVPTNNYVFYYAPKNGDCPESYSVGVPKKFVKEDEGIRYWIYEFDIVASAKSSFVIYSRNDAGKKSANVVETDDEIAIDVLEPTYEMSAYIIDNSTSDNQRLTEDNRIPDVNNPGWINGSIILSVKVKVGVSGIYLREMIMSRDSAGNVLVDASTGEIVWSMSAVDVPMFADPIVEGTNRYYIYRFNLSLPDNEVKKMSRDYKFRIYTGSGIYKEITFRANIDVSDNIGIKDAIFDSDGKTKTVAAGSALIDMDEYGYSVCKDTELTFTSTNDEKGFANHYNVYYAFFDGDGMSNSEMLDAAAAKQYALLKDGHINIEIPADSKGKIYLAVYVENQAVSYGGARVRSGYYVIKLSYDTVNLTISYDIKAYDRSGKVVTDEMQSQAWISGHIEVTVWVYINSEGDTKVDSTYSIYYMLIKDSQKNNISEAIANGKWIRATGATFTDDGTGYRFTIDFADASFCGVIAYSICNGAGYRNTQESKGASSIYIDNTTPVIDEAIKFSDPDEGNIDGVRGEISDYTEGGVSVNISSYYSTKEIMFGGVTDGNRSPITYYYKYLGQTVTSNEALLSDFTKLSGETSLFREAGYTDFGKDKYYVAYFAIYARNNVGTEAEESTISDSATGKVTSSTIFCFVFDSGSLTNATLTPDPTHGFYNDALNMFSYRWESKVNIELTAEGSALGGNPVTGYLKYQFSLDDGETWYSYLAYEGIVGWYASKDAVSILFTPKNLEYYYDEDGSQPFLNGVYSAFLFRAVNKAGAVKLYEKVHIAIDKTMPEFEIEATTYKNTVYEGGSTESLATVDKNDWQSGPIRIKINVTRMPVSGIKVTYYLKYLENGQETTTKSADEIGKELNNLEFTTDMLDGFNMNRDAILYVKVTSNSSSEDNDLSLEKCIRLSVDQTIPEFNLSGQAKNDNSTMPVTIVSGQWTNKTIVEMNRQVIANNVSKVVYTYEYRDYNGRVENHTWAEETGSIETTNSCVYTVTATSESGLTCTKEFVVNIDTVSPIITFGDGNTIINVQDGEECFIDLKVKIAEANIKICEYITIKGDTRGFAFADGYVFSTSSVDNSTRYDKEGNPYRGYVKVYVEDYAGNTATKEFYVLPFKLTVNNITLSDEDRAQVDAYKARLAEANSYIESSRKAYFENLISRLEDRLGTLKREINGYRDYLEKLAKRTSFELGSDYEEMLEYMNKFNDYKLYGQGWICDAITGDSSSVYNGYYRNFTEQFKYLDGLMEKVRTVESNVSALPAINMVEREDYQDILDVYDAYKSLTRDQQACFTPNLLNKLTDLKKSCEVLLLTDEDTGIGIDGDFAPGATVEVTGYDKNSGTFTNAQALLAKTVSANDPRTIISINRIALEAAYSQTQASDITVTLPIPKDYRDYLYFAVYELSDDGAMTLVNNMTIQPDGESVVFKTEKLTTYVLCIKANMAATDTTDNEYGTVLGLPLTKKMIQYLIYGGIALFAIIILVVILMGIRHRRFLNNYNKAYRNSLYRKGVKGIPKGNKGV